MATRARLTWTAEQEVEAVKQQLPDGAWRSGASLARCVEDLRMERDQLARKLVDPNVVESYRVESDSDDGDWHILTFANGKQIHLKCQKHGGAEAPMTADALRRLSEIHADIAALATHTCEDTTRVELLSLKRRLDAILAAVRGAQEPPKPCANGHEWSNQFGDDWTPEQGSRCDCGQKGWGERVREIRHHTPEFDNHHNALKCSYCNPDRLVLVDPKIAARAPQEPPRTNTSRMLNDYADLLDLLARQLNADPSLKFHRGFTVEQIRAEAQEESRPAPPLDWQPIETAPKDGSRIVVWVGRYGAVIARWLRETAGTPCWWGQVSQGVAVQPTHWMPLPAPPEALRPAPAALPETQESK